MPKSLQDMMNCTDEREIREWLKTASIEEVEEYIYHCSVTWQPRQYAIAERDRRYHRKLLQPHWTLTPGFWVAFAAMVFAAIAAWPVIHEWFWGSSH